MGRGWAALLTAAVLASACTTAKAPTTAAVPTRVPASSAPVATTSAETTSPAALATSSPSRATPRSPATQRPSSPDLHSSRLAPLLTAALLARYEPPGSLNPLRSKGIRVTRHSLRAGTCYAASARDASGALRGVSVVVESKGWAFWAVGNPDCDPRRLDKRVHERRYQRTPSERQPRQPVDSAGGLHWVDVERILRALPRTDLKPCRGPLFLFGLTDGLAGPAGPEEGRWISETLHQLHEARVALAAASYAHSHGSHVELAAGCSQTSHLRITEVARSTPSSQVVCWEVRDKAKTQPPASWPDSNPRRMLHFFIADTAGKRGAALMKDCDDGWESFDDEHTLGFEHDPRAEEYHDDQEVTPWQQFVEAIFLIPEADLDCPCFYSSGAQQDERHYQAFSRDP